MAGRRGAEHRLHARDRNFAGDRVRARSVPPATPAVLQLSREDRNMPRTQAGQGPTLLNFEWS